MDNIFSLHQDLVYHNYEHNSYKEFKVFDPKLRNIHKASVRDRLLHHAIYRRLYPFFDKKFIYDSYSCRLEKGTHKAVSRFKYFFLKVSKNNTRTCWVLKGDIKRFFDSIDHEILINILKEYISDNNTISLLNTIIGSFQVKEGKGLPLGNLTSQLFSNIYLNKFDQFIKHQIHANFYIRYADDFIILSNNKEWLKEQINLIKDFLLIELKLDINTNKTFIKSIASGVDFLGWINFLDHKVLRRSTKRRMFRKLEMGCSDESLNSYLGLIKHGNSNKVKMKILSYKH